MSNETEGDLLPLSALNHLMFCERRCALIHIEGVFEENPYTLQGTLLHEMADTPGYSTQSGVRAVRGLPLYSHRLGLSGKADIIEFRNEGHRETACPVDYKRGRRRRWENDDVQLCAQALCLEEMLEIEVRRGAIFHAGSRHRREIEFTTHLRKLTVDAAKRLHELIRQARIPQAVLLPKCAGCSLRSNCMPELAQRTAMIRAAAARLFHAE